MGSQQAQLAPITNDIWATSSTSTFNHYGQVKYFRKNFKEYSKEDFRNISKEPVVKEIMSGMSKIGMEEAERRIAEYLKD